MFGYDNPLKLDSCLLYAAERICTDNYSFTDTGVFRLICVTSENCTLSGNNLTFSMKCGDCLLLPPGIATIFDIIGNCSFNMISFSVESGKYCDKFPTGLFRQIDISTFFFNDSNIHAVIDNICKEAESEKKIYSRELISLLCSQLLVYTIRHFNEKFLGATDDNSANAKLCNSVKEYIDNRIFTMKNLSEVATAMGYNYSYISTLFHKTTGTTLNNYFKQKRMDSAKFLLSDSKMSISEIARTMNYSSVYAFSKAFKEHFGSSPGHYSGRFSGKDF